MLNREQRRMSEKIGKGLMKKSFNEFEEISFAELQERFFGKMTRVPCRAWKNNHYVVQLYRCERTIFGKLFRSKEKIEKCGNCGSVDFHIIRDMTSRRTCSKCSHSWECPK